MIESVYGKWFEIEIFLINFHFTKMGVGIQVSTDKFAKKNGCSIIGPIFTLVKTT